MTNKFSTLLSLLILLSSISSICAKGAQNKIEVYPALSENQFMSERYQVSVKSKNESHNSYVYKSPNTYFRFEYDREKMSLDNHYTSFSFVGKVKVEIKLPLRKSISSVVVRPLSKHLKATVEGNIVTVELSNAANFYVEIDGEDKHPLFVFANPIEVNVPCKNDSNVIYFAPGVHEIGYKDGPMQNIPSGKTVYLAGGAYVKGLLKSKDNADITVRGRGILSGIDIPGNPHYVGIIDAHHGAALVEGIIITDAPSGYQGILAVNKKSTKSSLVDNVKMLGWASNSDCGLLGDNSVIKNCFFKINDDVIKPVKNRILYKDNIVWHQMVGSVIMLGWNNTEPCAGAIVSGLDVIACDRGVVSGSDGTPQAFFNLKNTNGGTYTNILVENVRMETKPYMLFGVDIKINDNGFTNNPAFNKGLGSIDGLIFRNIFVPETPSRISYFNGNGNVTATSTGDIKNVTFENIKIGNIKVTTQNVNDYITVMGNTSNFRYK